MEEAPNLVMWRDLHRRAAVAYRSAMADVRDPEAASPAGHWSAREIINHVKSEHGPDDNASVQDVMQLQMLTLDLAVHSWDLSRSQGSTIDLDDELCLALHAAFAPYTHLMVQDDAFAPPLPAAEGASPTERLIALTGRDPAWPSE